MRADSVTALVQRRHQGGDPFLGPTVQMPIRKLNAVGEGDHVAEEIRPLAKTLQNVGHFRSLRIAREPIIVYLPQFPRRVFFVHPSNKWVHVFTHSLIDDLSNGRAQV